MNSFWSGFEKQAKGKIGKGIWDTITGTVGSMGKSLQQTGKEWKGVGNKGPMWKQTLGGAAESTGKWIRKNPGTATAIGGGTLGAGGIYAATRD